ncbi:SpoIID/LytB domain-containing protein [Fuchsiella alkaliacetigena]|uniref:SpoIID/LytB domain-containing protein n=1 Tax=Fuchsiella alkaliacetigena TaxID=957042 RepID=UPI00200B32DA|nr:SpoIID/LytB domain-containing protein [Fuchsiella alkaliacetigena]MCK8824159.1 SpoIID/LytB domain-containing protein [Fuchsiella alkaliacetigena]
MFSKNKRRNLITLGLAIFLVIFAVTAVFKLKNEDFIAAHKYDADQLAETAKENFYQGYYQDSINYYHKILVTNSKDIEARKNLATVYETVNDYQAAIEEYKQIIELDPQKYYIYYNLGEIYYNLGHYQDALSNFEVAAENLEETALLKSTYLYLAQIYHSQSEYNLALEMVDSTLELDADSALAYYLLGQIKEDLGKEQAAIEAYNQVLRKDGSFENVYFNLAENYFNLDNYERAVENYQRVSSRHPNNSLVKERLSTLEQKKPELFIPEEEEEREERDEALQREVSFVDLEAVPEEVETDDLRIGLAEDREYLAFRVAADFVIKDKSNDRVIFQGSAKQVYQLDLISENRIALLDKEDQVLAEFTGDFIIESSEETAPILLHNIDYGQGYYWEDREDRQYRGAIEIMLRPGGSFTVVNLVDLESYLYAVVPSEMSAWWPNEALKVQAVAARSYTLFHLGKHASDGYDLCATVHCAAYNGAAYEHHNSNQAVNETIGEILTYNGQPINAVYSANSGGHTESSADIWGGQVPYLQGVTTTIDSAGDGFGQQNFEQDFPLAPYELHNWLRSHPESYSDNLAYGSPNRYRWQRIIKADYIEDKLDIGRVEKLLPVARAEGGTVQAVKVVGSEGEEVISRALRSFFGGLRNSRFIIVPEYGSDGYPSQFIFYGGGWGHNVGMDQVATANMVQAGYSYDQILLHFYTGVELEAAE